MINVKWARWIVASIHKHFDDNKGSLNLYVEGTQRNTNLLSDIIELRVDGPSFTETTKGVWKIYLEINVLIQTIKDQTNFHKIYDQIGKVLSIFTDISIYKYGDDDSFIACLQLIQDALGKTPIEVAYLGQIKPEIKLLRAMVEGHYKMFLEE